MDLFKTYKLWDIEPVKGLDTKLWDKNGVEYTDLYGGHAVISVGHSHPYYVEKLYTQLKNLGFYSNAVQNSLQKELASKLGKISGYDDYSLFLCNSGAEANENAMKLASFATSREKILAFKKSFHGRTSGAVAATDNPKIVSPFNKTNKIVFAELNDIETVKSLLADKEFAAVIIEGIQGVAGIYEPNDQFLKELRDTCDKTGTILILDEVQSGYGRTGKFFAHQYSGIRADIISVAKGMGNGFPIGGILISPSIQASYGMLGTTFGGNHLACTAALAVLDIIENEKLVENAAKMGEYFKNAFKDSPAIIEYRGKGLMIGMELKNEYTGANGEMSLRDKLLFEKKFFTGAAGASVIRLLPSLTISEETANNFIKAWNELTK